MAALFGRLTSFSLRFSFSIPSERDLVYPGNSNIAQLIKHLVCLLGEFYIGGIRQMFIMRHIGIEHV
jgi:hypothetical protein